MRALSKLISDHRACMRQANEFNHAKAGEKPKGMPPQTQFVNKNPAHRAASDNLSIAGRITTAASDLVSQSMRRAIVEMFNNAPWPFIIPACGFCMAWMLAQFLRGRAIGNLIDILFKSQTNFNIDPAPNSPSVTPPSLKDMLTLPILFALLEWLFNVLWDFFSLKAKTSLIVNGRTRYFRALLSQPLEFHSGISSAELAARLISDSEAIDDAIVHAPCHLLRGVFTLVVAGYIIYVDPWLFILGLALRLPWLLQFVEYAITVVSNYELLEGNASNIAQAHANEVFASIVTVQACTAEGDEEHRFKGHMQDVSRIAETGSVVACGLRNVENGLTLASEIVILAYGVTRVFNGHITFGVFMALKAHMEMFVSQFNFFEKSYVAVRRASIQSARMFHFYDLHAAFEAAKTQSFTSITSDTSSCHSAPASDKTPIVEFANVSFSYPNTTPQFYGNSMPVVLSDVSFSVQRQSLTAIMGASGSGKSSIGKLLLQFYSPSSGAVYLNSSVCKVPDSAFKMREIVSWVDQVRNAKLIACVITPESDVCRAVVF